MTTVVTETAESEVNGALPPTDIARQRSVFRLAALFGLAVCVLALRLFWWQVIRGPNLAAQALRQQDSLLSLDVPRGEILDADLTPLTDPRQALAVVAYPAVTRDRSGTAAALARLTGVAEATLAARLGSSEPAVRLASGLDLTAAKAVEQLKLPGIVVLPEQIRYGPNALACHTVGYINGTNHGVAGVEREYDGELRGDSGDQGQVNVVLTVDASVQRIVEDAVRRLQKKGAVVVLDVASGDIVALASAPAYSQREPERALDSAEAPFINRALSGGGYSPGSTFKLITLAAALEHGLTRMDEVFLCNGSIDVGSLNFRCHASERGGHGALTLREGLAQSCNLVFIQLAQRVGAAALLEMAQRFGFGSTLGTGLSNESAGNLPAAKDVFAGDLANLAIGQGALLATPLQVAHMMNIIANDGIDPGVRLVRELRDGNNIIIRRMPSDEPRRIISSEIAQEMQAALAAATDHGTATGAFVPEFGSAGKTGSAEAAVDGREFVNAWFVGYAPQYRPRYVVAVLTEEGISGSQSAVPIFREIMMKVLR